MDASFSADQGAARKPQDDSDIAPVALLYAQLDELIGHYRKLLDIVRVERDLLMEARVEELIVSNQQKEQLLAKIAGADARRIRAALALGQHLKLVNSAPRLLELSTALRGKKDGEKLKQYHATISILFERLQTQNQENEILANSALRTVGGALDNIKETLAGKKTYQNKGQYKLGPERSGNFVSKEA